MPINCLRIEKLLVNKYDRNFVTKLRNLMSMLRMLVLCIWGSVASILMLWREELCNNSWLKDRNLLLLGMRSSRTPRLFDPRPKLTQLGWLMRLLDSLVEPKLRLRSLKLLKLSPKCCPRILTLASSPLTIPVAICLTLKFDFYDVYHTNTPNINFLFCYYISTFLFSFCLNRRLK